MKDQLAMYAVDDALFQKLPEMDFIEGGEVSIFLERKGRHVAEFITEGDGSIGEVLTGLQAIMGAPFGDVIGRNNAAVGPTGPHTFCGHVDAGTLQLLVRTTGEARRLVGKDDDERGKRLKQLELQQGHDGWFSRLLPALERFLGKGSAAPGKVITVYERW